MRKIGSETVSECPCEYALRYIVGAWKVLIVARLTQVKIRRHGEIKRPLRGITPKILTRQLREPPPQIMGFVIITVQQLPARAYLTTPDPQCYQRLTTLGFPPPESTPGTSLTPAPSFSPQSSPSAEPG